MKRLLAMALVFTMVMSIVLLAGNLGVVASGVTLYENNFETSDTTGWTIAKVGAPADDKISFGVAAGRSYDWSKALKISETDATANTGYKAYKAFTTTSSGKVTIDFDMQANGTSSELQIFSSDFSKIISRLQFYTGIGIRVLNGGAWNEIPGYTVAGAMGQWNNFKLEIDLTNKKTSLYVNNVLTNSGLAFQHADATNIGQFLLQVVDTTQQGTAIDNLKIYTGAAVLTPISTTSVNLTEDFNSQTAGNKPNGFEVSSLNTSTSYSYVIADSVGKDNTSALKMVQNNASQYNVIVRDFPRQTAKTTFAFDFKPDLGTSIHYFEVDDSTAKTTALIGYNAGAIIAYNGTAMVTLLSGATAGNWYNIKAVINPVTKTYDLYVNNRKKATGFAYYNATAGSDLAKIQIKAGTNTSTGLLIDNLAVFSGEPVIPFTPIYQENFNSGTTLPTGWTTAVGGTPTAGTYSTTIAENASVDGTNAMKIVETDSAAGTSHIATYRFEQTSGITATLEFDAKFNGTSTNFYINNYANTSVATMIRYDIGVGIRAYTSSGVTSALIDPTGTIGVWHKYAIKFDIPNDKFSLYIDGNIALSNQTIYQTAANDIGILSITCADTTSAGVLVDNIMIYEGGPEQSVKSAKLKNDTSLSGATNVAVSGEEITVAFEKEVLDASFNSANFAVTDSNNNVFPVTVTKIDGYNAKVAFNNTLNYYTDYTLTIQNVRTKNGVSLATPFTASFKTADYPLVARNLRLTDANNLTLTSLSEGQIYAKADVYNNTDAQKSAVIVLAIYENVSGNLKLSNIATYSNNIAAGTQQAFEVNLNLSGDLSGYVAKAFTLDSLTNLIPLASSVRCPAE